MFRKLSLLAASLAACVTLTAASTAMAANNDYRVEARMRTGTPLEAKGVYRERLVLGGTLLRQRFAVELEGAAANTSYEVRINGNLFGNIVTNDFGRAEMEFSTVVPDNNPHDEDPPLPTDFPHINVGDTISVGPLSGTFAPR